ncbi:hypothetical protein [Polyangium jinanense]|uniref:Uncharacterized protein n=1 Tax=Polyangium jinanense TaxID=2829994 RepID=A0A9X4AWX3_9BACT|nr:hypothetical protein [Polyangium jinanense]MDC3958664.1 hypothetical protein [Polyangium jinanense]MDC3987291.1 hypothetical protein [Polyangium jinanense]
MLRFAVLRALAIAAVFAVVWLVPLRAYAAIVPACEDDASSSLGPAPRAAQPESEDAVDCTAPPTSIGPSDEVDPQIAAMCDERGATAVAPGRIHPMTDARIDAGVSCDGTDFGPALGPSHGEQNPIASFVATVPDAMLSASFDLRPAFAVELPAYPPVEGAPLRGVRREIDRPPRA